jgi:hypothetical protein
MTIKRFQPKLATFTVSSASATAGAVYTNNSCSFTVLATIASKTTLKATASGTPEASGTLTKVSGTGDSTITFSLAVLTDAYGTDALNPSGIEGQSDYSEYAKVGIVGMPFDIAEVKDVVSPVAYETIGLGLGIVRMPSYSTPGQFVARLPRANHAQLVLSANFVSGDVLNLKVNGTSMAAVTMSGTPATDAAAICTALEAMEMIDDADIDASDTTYKTFDIYSKDGLDCLITSWAVTIHSTGLTGTITLDTTDLVLGLSMQTQGKEQDLGTLVLSYKANDVVNCMSIGRIWVFSEVAVQPNDPVYVRLQDGTTTIGGVAYTAVRGGLRNDSDGGTCVLVPNWYFFQGCTDANNGLAVVQTK